MTNLEFIEKQIDTYKRLKERAILNIADEVDDDELFKLHERIDIINERLPILQQIKKELEAWEVVKKYVKEISINGIAFERIINVSHTKQNYEIVKKALEVNNNEKL